MPSKEKASNTIKMIYPSHVDFANPSHVHVDTITKTPAGRIDTKHRYDLLSHSIHLHDIRNSAQPPGLVTKGFTLFQLANNKRLQSILRTIHSTAVLTEHDKKEILSSLSMKSFQTSDQKHNVRIVYPVPDGLFLRQAGPNKLKVYDNEGRECMPSAENAHVDNNVDGTLKQLMRGWAPWIFHFTSPGKKNHVSPLFIMRIWIPLQQPVRPLCVLNQQTFNRTREQIAFHLPTGDFLQKEQRSLNGLLSHGVKDDLSLVDVWHTLHGEQQEWWFQSDMNYTQALAFSTLDGAHTSCSLPGESVLAELYHHLNAIMRMIKENDETQLSEWYQINKDKILTSEQAMKKLISYENLTPGVSKGASNMLQSMQAFNKEMDIERKNRQWDAVVARMRFAQRTTHRMSVEVTALAWVTNVEWGLSDYCGIIFLILVLVMMIKSCGGWCSSNSQSRRRERMKNE